MILSIGIFIFIAALVAFVALLRYFEKAKELEDEGLTDENEEIARLESMQIDREKKK